MKTISLKVTADQDRLIEEAVRKRGFPSKSEFVRYAVARVLEDELSVQTLEEIVLARKQVRGGKTIPLEELVAER